MKHVLAVFAAFAALAACAITTTLEYEDARETLTRAAVSNDVAQAATSATNYTDSVAQGLSESIAAAARSATNYTDEAVSSAGYATPSMVTNIVTDVAPSPGDYANVSNRAVNALSRAEAEAGFTEWKCEPAALVSWHDSSWHWGEPGGDAPFDSPESEDPNAVRLTINVNGVQYTATRTRLPTMADIPTAQINAATTTNALQDAELESHASQLSQLSQSLDGKVPTSRTINGKALSSNISLSASDVGALGNSGNQTLNGLLRVYLNEYRLGSEVLLVGSKTYGLGLNPSQIIFFDNGIKYTIEVPPATGTLALTSDIPSLSGQTFNFATTQGVMDALKTVIETLGGTVTNAPSLTISQGE